uniref:Uncharacterized protein n=1 Tax=Arundo donax TaxID=35708 RepID=A0A0A8ZYP3_ARUDO
MRALGEGNITKQKQKPISQSNSRLLQEL